MPIYRNNNKQRKGHVGIKQRNDYVGKQTEESITLTLSRAPSHARDRSDIV